MKRVIFATLLLLSSNVLANENIVKITKISDGDTIKVILDGEEIGVRFLEIDCFETKKNRRAIKQSEYYHLSLGEVFKKGNYSKQKLKDKLSNHKEVRLVWQKKDIHKRILGYIYTLDGININEYMLKDGGCIKYQPFSYKK